MFISSPQKAYFEKMSGDEQAKLQQMDRAKMKEILEELIADDAVQAKTPPTPKRKENTVDPISKWDITGDHNGCLVCGNEDFSQAKFSLK